MDDSGFFSVQVISRALSVWSLDLVPLQSSNPAAVRAKNSAIAANAYICNFRSVRQESPACDNTFPLAGNIGSPFVVWAVSGSTSTVCWRAPSWSPTPTWGSSWPSCSRRVTTSSWSPETSRPVTLTSSCRQFPRSRRSHPGCCLTWPVVGPATARARADPPGRLGETRRRTWRRP